MRRTGQTLLPDSIPHAPPRSTQFCSTPGSYEEYEEYQEYEEYSRAQQSTAQQGDGVEHARIPLSPDSPRTSATGSQGPVWEGQQRVAVLGPVTHESVQTMLTGTN